MDEKIQEIQELTDEELDNVAGGGLRVSLKKYEFYCPKCQKEYTGYKRNRKCPTCKTPLTVSNNGNSLRKF